ncbi:MAG TPA: NAD(P)-dependent methylenetetrahydromethanopterin dehydrogenase [Gemmatimonadaceae bacterium]|nr:NAD(P)-dependent methylenetetrahydromethanopterin dehydrogenase [Gemmatimonadaceae bacterium]
MFDRVVAFDGGADEVLSYAGVAEPDVRDLVHGCIFTRGPKDRKNTAIFVGGADMAAGERLLDAVRAAFFGPFRVSVMLDSNGSNTTAVAAVDRILEALGGDAGGARAVVTAGTGPVGTRVAGLLAAAGADVLITSRHAADGERVAAAIARRFGHTVQSLEVRDPAHLAPALDGATVLCNAGPAGVMIVPRAAWTGRKEAQSLRVVVDLNAVPPLGVEGIEVNDSAVERDGVVCFGALGVGNFKMKLHRRCIARLFERDDLVLDAESIAEVAGELSATAKA